MFAQLIKLYFGGSEKDSDAATENLVVSVDSTTSQDMRQDQMLCVFSRGQLVSFHRERTTTKRKSDEQSWLVPRDDVELGLILPCNESTVEVDVKIRFEPESELFGLLHGRDSLTEDDISSLVTSQLGGLVDSFVLNEGDKLPEQGGFDRERLRAKLSLLLQNRGLRCTELGKFAVVPVKETVTPVAEAEPEEKRTDDVNSPPPQTDETARAEIAEVVNTADNWGRLITSVESAGIVFDETTASQLDELDEAIVDRRVQADEVSARLKQMAEEARGRAGIGQAELRRLRGLDLRLDWAEPEEVSSADRPGAPEVSVKRRPWTWWILNRKRVDERLLGFLNHAVREMKVGFDAYRGSQKFGPELVKLRRINERLDMAMDLLDTVPTLTPSRSELRPDRTKIKELVKSVERAVTPTETALAEVRELQKAAPGSDPWSASCDEICAALDQLAEQLRQRRNVR